MAVDGVVDGGEEGGEGEGEEGEEECVVEADAVEGSACLRREKTRESAIERFAFICSAMPRCSGKSKGTRRVMECWRWRGRLCGGAQ